MAVQEEIAVAMDIGGTWIRAGVVDRQGKMLWNAREPTYPESASEELPDRVERVARQAVAQAGTRPVRGIGLALAGPIEPESGIMHNPPNIPEMDGVSLKARWGDSLGFPIVVGNDANLAALAEYTYGAGIGARALVYITVSTGIGTGVIVDGEILLGAHGMASELGHMIVEMDGPSCTCGNKGCLEAIASGTAIADTARNRIAQGEQSLIASLVSGNVQQIGAPEVFGAAAQGDRLAQDIIDRAARALGAGLVNVLHIFDPDLIIIGGSVSEQWDILWPIVEPYVLSHAMRPYRETFKVARRSLGDETGMLGAAALVWRSLEPHSTRP